MLFYCRVIMSRGGEGGIKDLSQLKVQSVELWKKTKNIFCVFNLFAICEF